MTSSPLWRRSVFICLCLAAATAAVYWPVRHFEFTNYDDTLYVTENPHVQGGLTPQSIAWAFTTAHFSIWAPLTWLSCMLDCQLFRLNAGAHHTVNVLFHIANALLLFIVLNRMTAAAWRSAVVAALFALHPLHVESVAWVAERKDVLSTFFWMLTLLAYVCYVERPSVSRYGSCVGLYALGLMAKPMLVTLPFVLLLLDYWPLGRTRWVPAANGVGKKRSPGYLLREKVPFVVLAIPACVVTYWAEQHGGSVIMLDNLPLGLRLANAVMSYARYLGKTFWPVNLAVYYPYQTWPPAAVWGAGAVLTGISCLMVWKAKHHPCLVTGWLVYLGTLVPVIGLVQVGSFSMADRYTYVPLVGLFVMAAWCLPRTLLEQRRPKITAATTAGVLLASCAVASALQVRYWRNSETLFRHALTVTQNNFLAHENLGKTLAEHGKISDATAQFAAALQIKPDSPSVHVNLGNTLAAQGKLTEAIREFQTALRLKPDSAEARYNLGVALASRGSISEAMQEFAAARQINPDHVQAHYNLGALLASQGRTSEAIVEYRQALRLKPNWPLPLSRLAWTLATCRDANIRNGGEAVQLGERLGQATGYQQAESLDILAAAYAEAGRFSDAIRSAEQALALANTARQTNLAPRIRERLDLYQAGHPYHEDSGSP
jgi:Tfp pilus assembly protein PilF